VASTTKAVEPSREAVEDVRHLLDRARKGDQSTLPYLRKVLEDPNLIDFLGGNLARQAELSFVGNAAGGDLAFREALLRKLELMRAELSGPNPTPVERLLVERVVACWLQVQDADIRCAHAQKERLTPAWADYLQRRMDRSHRRYMSAIRTLALVRRLAVPALLVNVAQKQQVNVLAEAGR
jgi:hypothetical protein